MKHHHRELLIGAVALLLLAGCDFASPWGASSNGTDYGATAVTGNTGGNGTGGTGTGTTSPTGGIGGEPGTYGTDDTVIATSSTPSVAATVGASQTLSVTFTSSDGLAITGFGVSGSLGTLPAGWSGPGTFTCPLVTAGSGCVLNLTYAPTAVGSGTLVIDYVYVDNAGLARSPGGSISIPYEAIVPNNVVGTVSPAGQINAAVGGGVQSVSITFTTDADNAMTDSAATNLAVTTNLAALPAGWTSPSAGFSCAIVSTGSGCELVLNYAPAAAARGTLTVDYSYTDDSGAARTGQINIPYSSTVVSSVVATASPTGQINAAVKSGSQPVTVTFVTDDGKAATNLTITSGLAALPAGWSSGSGTFSCASVSTGNGCQLGLTYAPTALGSGTLTLGYAYTDDTGTARTGTFNLAYAATTNDNVVATPSPSGQINALVAEGSQPVSVVFTTDDGRLATALRLTTSLAALPPGWSSTASGLVCPSVSSGSDCALSLTYKPQVYSAGTLTLNYSYKNNAGRMRTGSLAIPYRATTDDSIAGTPNPKSPISGVTGISTPVSVTFVTDDGLPASALSVTSGLDALPAGWTSTEAAFTCATVSAGTVCQLPLTYAPTAVVGNSMLTLGYSYTNDAGFAKTGTVNIVYRATSNDTVIGTVSPNPVTVVSGGSLPVTVTFTTNDGNPASALSVTTGLTTLPAGWSTTSASFTCATVSAGTVCQLPLTYAPTAVVGNSTLTLGYSYSDDSGHAKTGNVTIDYSAT
jgi:hypothetical protein